MFMDFMDYSDDDCYNLFTIGQAARMSAVLSNPPYNGLTTSNGCVSVGNEETFQTRTNSALVMYPNPAHDFLQLETFQEGILEVTNVIGITIFKKYLLPGKDWVDLTCYTVGIYFIRFTITDGTETQKLILSR